ncbi:MAG: thymidine phosphorylase family protein [Nanoarchaeales archaeon]|nr:thymidine phosphorylase family protein [Nanoarchaeales archaeon]
MFKIKKLNISITTGGFRVMLNHNDAEILGLKVGDRVKLSYKDKKSLKSKKKELICDLGIITAHLKNKNIKLKDSEIGVYTDVFEKLELKENGNITLTPAPKPVSLEYVRKKFNGKIKLKESHFKEIINDIIVNKFTPIETTFFVLACAAHPLDDKEVIGLTKAMVDGGKNLTFKTKNGIIVDKHCIGGIPGNRTTMVVIPILAAAGLTIPKTSSRSITSPAGTADTMEVLTHVDISLSQMHKLVSEIGGCIAWGGSLDLSPADDAIIHVEHPLEIDVEGQMIASIMSKKKSAGSTHVLLDIPVGETAKVKTKENAIRLKKRFVKIGKAIGIEVKVIITDGSEPIGKGIGPYLEAMDVLKVLNNDPDQPYRLRNKSLMMAGHLLEMGGLASKGHGLEYANEVLESGLASRKFEEIVVAQGKRKAMSPAKYSVKILAQKSGTIKKIDNKGISTITFILGCPADKASGLILHNKCSDKIKKGSVLVELFSNSKQKLNYAKAHIEEDSPFIIK